MFNIFKQIKKGINMSVKGKNYRSDWADQKKDQITFLEMNNIMIAIINLLESFNSVLYTVKEIIRLM